MVKATIEMDGAEKVVEGEFMFGFAATRGDDGKTDMDVIISGIGNESRFTEYLANAIPGAIEKVTVGDPVKCLDSMIELVKRLESSIREYSKEHFDEIAQEIKRLLEEDLDAVK